jgi:hypothetical protein
MWKETELAYLAGIIDGEGSIYVQGRIRFKSIHYFPRFQIVNTDRKLMEWIHKTFGGLIYDKCRKKHNPKWKMQIEWFTTRGLLDQLLPLIIPFLVTKKEHALILIEFRKTYVKKFGSQGVPKEIQDFRIDCHNRLKLLNKRGI